MSKPNAPAVTYTVWGIKKQADPEPGERHDTYSDHKTAREFATDLVENAGFYDAHVVNSKGVRIWEARKNGVRKVKRKK